MLTGSFEIKSRRVTTVGSARLEFAAATGVPRLRRRSARAHSRPGESSVTNDQCTERLGANVAVSEKNGVLFVDIDYLLI